ncbi:methyltransferase protein, partial [Schaereria dolodes]|nr:methyltransferase protein [Schaereria dolodes]
MGSQTSENDWKPAFYVGQHESKRVQPVTDHTVWQAYACEYNMLTAPITNDYFHSRVLTLLSSHLINLDAGQPSDDDRDYDFDLAVPTIPALSQFDSHLSPRETTSHLFAVVSPWIDLCSPDPLIASISRQTLELEIAYAAFCGVENVIITGPRIHHGNLHGSGLTLYARAIHGALSIGTRLQIHIQLPMIDHPDFESDDEIDHLVRFAREEYLDNIEQSRSRKAEYFGTWDAWNIIRTVYLSLPRHLPPLPIQSRWYSEPVRVLSISGDSFVQTQKGYPILSTKHEALISRFMRTKTPPWILLCDVGPISGLNNLIATDAAADGYLSPSVATEASRSPTPAEAAAQPSQSSMKIKDHTSHLAYIRGLQKKQPPRTEVERYGSGYQDYLQTPLQPLTDNLESMTYEVFEKDPIKYDLYKKAIRRALRDWVDQNRSTSSGSHRVVVVVAGAGRGPLVTRALEASQIEGVEIDLWAVEKNPNAYVLLQRHNVQEWGNQ